MIYQKCFEVITAFILGFSKFVDKEHPEIDSLIGRQLSGANPTTSFRGTSAAAGSCRPSPRHGTAPIVPEIIGINSG